MTAPPMAIAAVEVVGVGEHHVDRHQAPVVAVRRVREPAALGVLVVLHHLGLPTYFSVTNMTSVYWENTDITSTSSHR